MNKFKHLTPIAALVTVLMTTQASAGPISVSESGFDGTTTVSLSKHGTHCVNFSRCGYIGLQWSDKEPDMVIVQAGTFSEASIRRLSFSYGEVTKDYGESPLTMDVFKEGATTYWGNRFVIPLADLKEAGTQDRWWMRLSGFDGSLDFPVVKDGKKSKVAKRLPEFLETIEEIQG